MILDIKAAVSDESSSESEAEVKPKAKATNSKRKRSPSPSSSSASSSEDSSDSDAPPAKKRVVEKKASSASSSDSSSSDSSSDSSSESSSDSSSDSDSSSESDAPAPKKKVSKKETAEKKPKEDKKVKEKKEKKEKSDDSAASSVTVGRVEVPEATVTPTVAVVEDPTIGIHPARLAMIDGGKPKAAAVAVVQDKGVKPKNVPFSRISADQYVDPRLASNAYVPYDYAEKAHRDLIVTKGKGFTKEKNKKKRGKSCTAIRELS
jgi:hypothetical protein